MSELNINSEGHLTVRCPFDEKDKIKNIGGKWDKIFKCWILPFTVGNIQYLLDNLNCTRVSTAVETRLQDQIQREDKLGKIKKMAKTDKPVQFKITGIKLPLYNYQKLGVLFALTNPSGMLLADDMGLGKTIQAIATACYKKYKEGIKKCLIITPASLKWNWPLEIEKFTDEKYVVIDGPSEERIRQWQRDDVFFYIVNYELVLEDLFGGREYRIDEENDDAFKIAQKMKLRKKAEVRAERLENIRNCVWDMIVIDEIHYMKSHTSKRSKNVKALKSRYRMALTGTPMDGKLEELHSVMEFVQPGLFQCKTRFLQRHAVFDFWGKITSYKNINEVRERIQPFFLRRLKKDVMKELPDKIYQNRYVLLSTDEIRTYKDIAKRGHSITEDVQAMVAVIRAKQFCDCPQLVDIHTKVNSKLEEFKNILRELVIENGHKVIVFSQYAKMCEILIKEIEAMSLKYLYIWGGTDQKRRVDMQEEFNKDPKIDIIIGTDAMSCGLNLTGADYVINYDDFWSPSIMAQREDRSHRIGQKNVVTVINFICRDTIEERIRDVLYNKSKVTAETLGDNTEESILRRLNPRELAQLL